jgi:hypothetical protein
MRSDDISAYLNHWKKHQDDGKSYPLRFKDSHIVETKKRKAKKQAVSSRIGVDVGEDEDEDYSAKDNSGDNTEDEDKADDHIPSNIKPEDCMEFLCSLSTDKQYQAFLDMYDNDEVKLLSWCKLTI